MIPIWPGLVEESEQKGLADGASGASYSPIMQRGFAPDADDAYCTAYWHGVGYGRTAPQGYYVAVCGECKGSGRFHRSDIDCPECEGHGTVHRKIMTSNFGSAAE